MKINDTIQSNIDFYRYASIKILDAKIDMYKKLATDEDNAKGDDILIVIGSLEGLTNMMNIIFKAYMNHCNTIHADSCLYEVIIGALNDKITEFKNQKTHEIAMITDNAIAAFEFDKKLLHDIAKEGGFLDE